MEDFTIQHAEIWLEKLEHLESKAAKLLHIKNLILINEKLKVYPPMISTQEIHDKLNENGNRK